MDDQSLIDKVSIILNSSGLAFEREPTAGGLQPDFIVHGPEGEKVIIEVKEWNPRNGNTARAWDQVQSYTQATGADHTFIVMPDSKKNFINKGVVNIEGLTPALNKILFSKKTTYISNTYSLSFLPKGEKIKSKHETDKKMVFAAMPFDKKFDDTYFVAMTHAANEIDAICKRVDKEDFSGDVVEKIKNFIDNCIAVIVDLSELKPNVLYEAGYAHALRKPTIHICSTPLETLPFDVRNWNTLKYDIGQTYNLKEPLSTRLKSVLNINI